MNIFSAKVVITVLIIGLAAGCGGGSGGGSGGDSGVSSAGTRFIDWNGNNNDDVVLDANSDRFKVTADARELYSVSRDAVIANTFVDTGATIYLNNQEIGSVILAAADSGGEIAALAWLDSSDGNWKLLDVFTDNNVEVFQQTENLVPLSSSGSGGGSSSENADDELFVGTPVTLTINSSFQGRLSSTDGVDHYRFTANSTGTHLISLIDFGSSDLDLDLIDNGLSTIGQSTTTTASESISFNATADTEYFIKVYVFGSLSNSPQSYSISVAGPGTGGASGSNGGGSVGVGSNSVQWQFTDACNDNSAIHLRFHEVINGSLTGFAWPGGSNVYVLTGTQNFGLSCDLGTSVCYGAERATNSGGSFWGAGLDGTSGCSNCCISCSGGTVTLAPISLSCN